MSPRTESPWKYFSVEELACRHCGEMKMNADFMDNLVKLRLRYGRPMIINSAYRCPAWDQRVGKSAMPGKGAHTTGHAADIKVYGAHYMDLFDAARAMKCFTGFGADQKLGSPMPSRYLHIDDLTTVEANGSERPFFWNY